jgi:hypothetical protein
MPNEPLKIETTSGKSSIRNWLMTTTWGNIAIILGLAAGFFLFGAIPHLIVIDGGWEVLTSPKFVLSCFIAGLVFGTMIIEVENPILQRFSPWLRIMAGGTCGVAIALIWDASFLTLLTSAAVGTVFGFFSHWLDF